MIRPLLAPRMLGLHLLAALAVCATVALGLWQYGAWQDGRHAATSTRVHAAPRPLTSVMSSDEAFPADGVGQPVTLAGRWLPRSTFYVSGRTLHGRTGLWAVTPVEVCATPGGAACAGRPAILVVRGWTPRVSSSPAAPTGAVRITGWLQPGEGSGDSDPDPTDDVVPQLRVADVLQRVRQDLYGGYVIARDVSPAAAAITGPALEAVTPPALPKASSFTSLRNLLYAIEWWVFAGFAVMIWWRWCRDEVTRVTGVASSV